MCGSIWYMSCKCMYIIYVCMNHLYVEYTYQDMWVWMYHIYVGCVNICIKLQLSSATPFTSLNSAVLRPQWGMEDKNINQGHVQSAWPGPATILELWPLNLPGPWAIKCSLRTLDFAPFQEDRLKLQGVDSGLQMPLLSTSKLLVSVQTDGRDCFLWEATIVPGKWNAPSPRSLLTMAPLDLCGAPWGPCSLRPP